MYWCLCLVECTPRWKTDSLNLCSGELRVFWRQVHVQLPGRGHAGVRWSYTHQTQPHSRRCGVSGPQDTQERSSCGTALGPGPAPFIGLFFLHSFRTRTLSSKRLQTTARTEWGAQAVHQISDPQGRTGGKPHWHVCVQGAGFSWGTPCLSCMYSWSCNIVWGVCHHVCTTPLLLLLHCLHQQMIRKRHPSEYAQVRECIEADHPMSAPAKPRVWLWCNRLGLRSQRNVDQAATRMQHCLVLVRYCGCGLLIYRNPCFLATAFEPWHRMVQIISNAWGTHDCIFFVNHAGSYRHYTFHYQILSWTQLISIPTNQWTARTFVFSAMFRSTAQFTTHTLISKYLHALHLHLHH